MKTIDYTTNGEPISARNLVPQTPNDEELDESTSELLRQLEVPIPDDSEVDEANACDKLQLSNTIALYYQGKTYFVDPTDYDDVEFFLTSVLDTFFGYHGSDAEKKEFCDVVKKLLKAIPTDMFNEPENKLLRLLVPLPQDAVMLAFCSKVETWTEERYLLLLFCAKSVFRIPNDFLSRHAKLNLFRKVVYDTDDTFGDCRQSGWAYSQIKAYLDSCV